MLYTYKYKYKLRNQVVRSCEWTNIFWGAQINCQELTIGCFADSLIFLHYIL